MVKALREGLSLVLYCLSAFFQDLANNVSTTTFPVIAVDNKNYTITVSRQNRYKVGDKVYIGR